MNLLIFILVTYGLNKLYSEETIFKWLRYILRFKPFSCATCLSVWIGIALSFIFPPIAPVIFILGQFSWLPLICLPIINCLVGGVLSYASFRIIEAFIDAFELKL